MPAPVVPAPGNPAVGTPAEGETPPAVTEETIGRLLAGAPAHNLEFVLP